MDSSANVTILVDNPELKTAALDSLATTYNNPSPPSLVDKQTAAIVAADISIQTVPAAAALSSSIVGALVNGSAIPQTDADIGPFVKTLLPADITSSLGSPTPPASFTAMILAFSEANAAYMALGGQVMTQGGFVADSGLTSDQTADIAINAVISGMITAIVPTNGESIALVLWDALNGGSPAFTLDPNAITNLTSGGGAIASLVAASSLGSLLGAP
jgi:hypothetical protein